MKSRNKRILMVCLAAVFLATQMLGLWTVHAAQPDVTDLSQLGDWNHYNGIIFGNMTSYAADSEGAIAVGGDLVKWGLSSGYDAGGSYAYYNTVHMGHYTNDNRYPTVLLGVDDIQVGGASKDNGHYNVHGGNIVMSRELKEKHDAGANRLNPNDARTAFAIADQELIDEWFDYHYRLISSACAQYLGANDAVVSYADFSSGAYLSRGAAAFVNQTLRYQGQVDPTVLVVNVESAATINSMQLPISAKWPQEYQLVIFNFPDAVNVTMSGNPQSIKDSVISDKSRPEGYLTAAGKAERNALTANVIYNFPNAQSINMSYVQLFGSLLAPDAAVSMSGGQINGQLVCTDYTTQNSGELHAYRWNRRLFDLTEEPEDPLAGVTLRKYLYYRVESEVPLAGARYQLRVYDKATQGSALYDDTVYVTDETGAFTITGLPLGEYLLREIQAPDGFDPDAPGSTGDIRFTLTQEHGEEALELTAYNEPLYTGLEFHKVAQGTRDGFLEGAQFQLIRQADQYDFFSGQGIGISFHAESGPDGTVSFSGLPMGSYVLKELAAPEGYERREDIVFEIVYQNGGLEAVLPVTGDPLTGLLGDELLVENEPGVRHSLSVFKYSAADPDPDAARGLEGARYHVYRQRTDHSWEQLMDGPEPVVIETDASGYGHLDDLLAGEYRLVELKAPEGFLAGNHLTDTVEPTRYAAQETVGGDREGDAVAEIPNIPLRTGIEVVKYGLLADRQTPLAEVTLSLYRLDELGREELVDSHTTPADGRVRFEGLLQGRYLLRETETAYGYRLLEEDLPIEILFDQEGNPQVTVDTDPLDGAAVYDEKQQSIQLVNSPYTGSLILYKMDRDRYQSGTDWDPDKSYSIDYLEGAVFQLQRMENGFSGEYIDFSDPFTTRFSGFGLDRWGNQMAGFRADGLPWGRYRVVEVQSPAGYTCNYQDGIVGSFVITQSMAEAQAVVEMDVSNVSDGPRSEIVVRKVDKDDPGHGLEGVEFKLWRIDDSQHPLTGREHIDEVMQNLMHYGQQKFDYDNPLVTDEDGYLTLDLEPGLYLLFEYEPAPGYLYTLERGQTLERATDPSFYHYSTLFRVVAMPDPADGVRVQWIDRYKLLSGDVIGFEVDDQDVDNNHWDPGRFSEADYRSFAITNRQESALKAAVTLHKLDEEGKALPGAVFALERAELKGSGDDTPYRDEDFAPVDSYTSDSDGITVSGLGQGMYRLIETQAPPGYVLDAEPVYFSLVIDGYAKTLDFYDHQGNRTPGYNEPVIQADGSADGAAVFVTSFPLGTVRNLPEDVPTGTLILRKVDAEDEDTGLPGAKFDLSVSDGAGGWTLLESGLVTGTEGVLTLNELPVGNYKLTETAPPDGYQDQGLELIFRMVLDGSDVVPNREDGNNWDDKDRLLAANTREEEEEDPTGTLILRKVDAEDEDTGLPDAKFDLSVSDGTGGWTLLESSLVTGAEGILTLKELPVGSYKLTETAPPDGYQDQGLELFFRMVLDGSDVAPNREDDNNWDDKDRLLATNTKEEEEEYPTGTLTLRKVDAEDQDTGLPDAKFELSVSDGAGGWTLLESGLVTSAEGILTLNELPVGSYKLTETAPPDGYQDQGLELIFRMVLDGSDVVPNREDGNNWDDKDRLLAANTREEEEEDPTGTLILRKVDAEDEDTGLPDAKFDLSVSDGAGGWTLLESGLTTGADGTLVLNGLPAGEYQLAETSPPDGYQDDGLKLFFAMILAGDRVIPDPDRGSWDGENRLLAHNRRDETPVETPGGAILLHKTDAESGRSLAGAVFALSRGDEESGWTLLETGLTTDEDGLLRIDDLEPGSYRLTETGWPEGYLEEAVSVFFRMELVEGTVTPYSETHDWDGEGRLTVPNQANPTPEDPLGELLVEKVDAQSGKDLAGAVFDLYRQGDDQPWRTGLTTDQDGLLRIGALPPGDYTLRETRAPSGYRLESGATPFTMVLQDGAVLPSWMAGQAEDADYLLYRWEAAHEEEEEEDEEVEEAPEQSDQLQEEDGDSDAPPDGESPEDGQSGSNPDANDADGDSDGDQDEDAQEEDDDADSQDGEPDTDDPADGEEPSQEDIPDEEVPLTDDAPPARGEWVLVSVFPFSAEDGRLVLGDLEAGDYRLTPFDPDSGATQRFFSLEEDAVGLELPLTATGDAEEALRITNRRSTTSEGGGNGGGSGGGSGGGFRPRDPEPPAEPSPSPSPGSADGSVGGVGHGPNDNVNTGAVSSGAMIGTGLGLAGVGGAYAGRKSIRWWLRGLQFRRKG